MKVINLTPHEVRVVNDEGNLIVAIPPAEEAARVTVRSQSAGSLEFNGSSVPLVTSEYGEIEGLPEPAEGVAFVVSNLLITAARAAGRTTSDLLAPADLVRDEAGRVIGCRALARN